MSKQRINKELYRACHDGNLQEVKRLLAAGADSNAMSKFDFFPLSIAAHQGHLEVVRCLLDNGADINGNPSNDR